MTAEGEWGQQVSRAEAEQIMGEQVTADGTYRPSTRVTTAAHLATLPIGSVVLDAHGDAGLIDYSEVVRYAETAPLGFDYVVKHYAPLTVLFRPDAPQPDATGNSAFPVADDAVERPEVPTWSAATVERAVQAACAEAGWDWTPEPGVPSPAESMRPIVVAALSIAMPHPAESQWRSATFYGKPDGGLVLSPREAAARGRRANMEVALDAIITAHPAVKHEDSQEADENYGDLLNELVDAALAAAGAGAEVDRGRLVRLIEDVTERAQRDGLHVASEVADALAVLAARGDAATPTVTAEQVRSLAESYARERWENTTTDEDIDGSVPRIRRWLDSARIEVTP